jgi:hypothetical protein
MRHESETAREFFLVVRMFDRICDPDKFVEMGKERNRLAFRVTDLTQELRLAERKSETLQVQIFNLRDELSRYRDMHGELPPLQAPHKFLTPT